MEQVRLWNRWLVKGEMVGSKTPSLALELKGRLRKGGIIVAPGVYDPISAVVAAKAGFEVLYLSGGALANSLGLPDLGMTTLSELVQAARSIVDGIKVPLIVDGLIRGEMQVGGLRVQFEIDLGRQVGKVISF